MAVVAVPDSRGGGRGWPSSRLPIVVYNMSVSSQHNISNFPFVFRLFMAVAHPITLSEHEFVEELITLWDYVRCHLVSATYKIEEEQMIFGDARFFTSLHRQQLFQLAQLRYEDDLRGIRIEKAKQFYQELLANVRNRTHIQR